jgi:hypothetical protein
MHRTPLSVLVIVAAMAACSTRDATAATELLSQDSTLAARLAMGEAPRRLPLPDTCGTVTAARPAVANASQAKELARRGYGAEALGKLQEARSLLRRASELDGTNESAAYHLGRTNEALGDRTAAVTAYCRFLALTPTTAESTDAWQRVARLSQPAPRVAAGVSRDTASTRRRARSSALRHAPRRRPPTEPSAVASATVGRSVPATSPERSTPTSNAAAGSTDASPSQHVSVTSSASDGATERTAAAGDVVAAPAQVPGVGEPSTASRTGRSGPSTAQRAGIGAAAGAIIGAVAGRSVKGALIGAAAGGIVGATIGGRVGPVGRGIRP